MSTTASKKIAIVTGASSGIGYAITKELAQHDYIIYACARRLEPMQPLVDEFSTSIIKPYKLDISILDEVITFKEFLEEELSGQKLDLLYNNAGQNCCLPALDISDADMQKCFQVNVFGHINMCRELSKYLINAKGTIVFTGSISGIVSFPFGSIYSATKAAIHAYARGLHLELKPFGVRVINSVTGGVNTHISDIRPLPKDSIYEFPEGKEAFESVQHMTDNYQPMSAEVYAKKLVGDILSSKDPVDVYRGSSATFLSFFSSIVPYFILESALIKQFNLTKAFEVLKGKKVEAKKQD
ncbi:similar to Saccharomyces cerevisiae YIL124W AYR1 NADPH-dependent 1-acyl dihydroxyacetone phosphate reductase found in lipid particles, ER, and mitochondrial outer membrane [Maudiozyma saulgeensis]|uniref:Similar to Saccharomyces cerevisiae YIL124W AYR1 NADPH-dependent 1-acyl dihydroxyacetone phosphate reductase found in lipid particles, ER, and mitochondrial outer membrane n=1 Tax=Maudiozyma saulgeensis TaxID=1789683 RepID=A0A1X7R6X9_9SACH|nr:similar to Saccharomyces cerevisiae YIL124W AYR1 NADPH-dependent 1-acyl dihydroxyacetone phosphate reductase found in lipid particles, ER, and mitochondrial outer membrane [Kazachstania saulgeensis]